MKRTTKLFWALVAMATLCLPVAYAQQQAPPTTPPASGGSQGTTQQIPASPVVGVTPTITGGLAPSVGDSGDVHSQLTLGLQYSELFDSNFQNAAGSGGWDEISTFAGHLDLHRIGAGSALTLSYSGGAYIAPRHAGNDSTYHEFTASETLQFRRWTLQLVDSFSYLPESSFGFGGAGGSGSPFLGITLLNPDLIPSQGILSTPANRFSNTAYVQASYSSSQRTAWTFSGSYGLLHFTNAGFLNSADYEASVGYNYQLTDKDIIGVSYQFDAVRFSPALASINDHTINFNYGRHISKQLSFQASAGPQLTDFTPIGGPSSGVHVVWNANAGLSYLHGSTTTNVSFSHGITSGAGILIGSTTDTGSVTVSHPLGVHSTITGSFGVSRNTSLPQASIIGTSYDSEYASIGVTRALGHQASLFVNYYLAHQTTNAGPCTSPVCGPQFIRHQIFVGFSWDMRPYPLR